MCGAGEEIEMMVGNGPYVRFTYHPKGVGETYMGFGERRIKSIGKGYIMAVELKVDSKRYNDEVEAIIVPSESVPEDIFE